MSGAQHTAPLIAVSGATGHLGGAVARELAARGARQRLLVRDRARAPKVAGAELAEIVGYEDGDSMQAALEGVDTFLLIPGHVIATRVAAHRTAIDAAVRAGVRKMVYVSFVGASANATFTFSRQHFATEEAVRASGLTWSIAQMNFYLDEFPGYVLSTGEIIGPGGDGKIAGIARDDVAAGVAAILAEPDAADGKIYELTGREALSFGDAAVQMARHSGKPITYRRETVEQAWESRAHYDAPREDKEGWITTYTAAAAGELERVTDHLLQLTGKTPKTLHDFLESHPLALAHVDSLG
jgi:NAD(P)H dehydrogenase (quinone)